MALALGHGALPLRPASALGSNGFIGLGSRVGAFWMGVNGSIYLAAGRVRLGLMENRVGTGFFLPGFQ